MSNILEQELKNIEEAAAVISSRLPSAQIAVVLGSGLAKLAEMLEEAEELDYTDIPHFPKPTVWGHSGKMLWGRIDGIPVYVFSGRFHYYEGHDPHTVILPMRVLHKLGCGKLVLTNAAGGINSSFRPGDLMVISDHINFTGYNPLRGENCDVWGPRFPDMSNMYDKEYRAIVYQTAEELGIELREGVYCGFSGPTFETPAEIRMMGMVGADAVGMSTVPEALAACQMGIRTLAVSCITNLAAGISKEPLSHEEVMITGKQAEEKFSRLIKAVIPRL